MAEVAEYTPASQEDYYPIYPVKFVAGDTVRFRIQITDPDPDWVDPDPDADPPNTPDMIPRDLTGYSARAQVRKNYKKISPLIATYEISGTDTREGPVTDLDDSGYIYIHLPPIESAKVEKISAWDLELTDPDGDVDTILGGPVDPFRDTTR